MCISVAPIVYVILLEIWKYSFLLSTLSLQVVGLGFFLACVLKGAEIDTAGFAEQEQQFGVAVSARGAAPGSGVSWRLAVSGAAAVSDSQQGISCSSGTKQSPGHNLFPLKEMHLHREPCLWFILSLHCYSPLPLQSCLFSLKTQCHW